jgi:iron(III) transport system substrate-binding protein
MMTDFTNGKMTRRGLLKAGTMLAAAPMVGIAAPAVLAQGVSKSPNTVLDFTTYADVAKAEQEGSLVFYCHENEAGTAAIMQGFGKDFPKIKTSYVRAQTGALYNKILSERSAGRFDVDVIQLSDVAPAVDFQKKGGYEFYVSPEIAAYRPENLSSPAGSFFWTGVDVGGIAYSTAKVEPADAPKTWQDILNPRWKGAMSCKISASGLQFVQWYVLRELYGPGFWKEFAKLNPHAFDSRVQLYDRLAKGDDKITAIGEYPAYILFKSRNAKVEFVAPPDGVPATPLIVGAVNKAPHPEAAKLFVDWAMSKRGQAWYQTEPNLYYGSVRIDAPPMPTGVKLSEFKLLYPKDWDAYGAARDQFSKEWNAMLGL